MVRCCSSYTVPAYIWAVLSILAAFLCPFGLYFSNWLEVATGSDGRINSISSFRLCLNESNRISVSCESYLSFSEIFSPHWQAVTLLMGIGCCALILVALTAIFGFFVRKLFNSVVVAITTSVQALGVLLFIVSIVLFPAGMGAPQVKDLQLCGPTADPYKLGDCGIGWAFILIIIGTVTALAAAIMSWTPLRWRDKDDDRSFSI